MSITPSSRPHIDRAKALAYLQGAPVKLSEVLVLAVRGYYLDTQGAPGRNDRGRYDDALVVLSPAACVAFNGNTDPSASRIRMAVLKPGVYRYKLGIHGLNRPAAQRYPAFVQAAAVTVIRDEVGPDTGWFGINIHRGGIGTTSSLGCQTVPPAQWSAFFELVKSELKRIGQKDFAYALIEETEFRARNGGTK